MMVGVGINDVYLDVLGASPSPVWSLVSLTPSLWVSPTVILLLQIRELGSESFSHLAEVTQQVISQPGLDATSASRHSPCPAFPRPAQCPGQSQGHFLKSFWSPLQLIGPESRADRCHLALRRRWQQRGLPGSGPPSGAPASAECSFMERLSRARQGSVGAVGPRAPGTRLVGASWPMAGCRSWQNSP